MEIFKDYTTSDVLFDIPYSDRMLVLYPIKVKDYKEFEKYIKFFLFSKKHYGLDNNDNLYEFIIAMNLAKLKSDNKNKDITNDELLIMTLGDMGRAFSLICRETISYNEEEFKNGDISFANNTGSISISRNNFEKIRQIILKQNVIKEPKIFANATEQRLGEKYMLALRKKSNGKTISELGEMANLISCSTGKTYEQLYEQNILQLYADFYRCASIESYKANVLFRTVSDTVKVNEYTEEIISNLYSDPYKDMWKDTASFGFLH